ncbi:hypothetical protein COLO4_34144 [Corchorus olitorius]|uniref:Uncharacterized protein n=1 Tax=Corchorus olitorius TaxID=93759 RepID=A0A1R3GNC5_9ROSI|nr:hypothetical protein COLO4_34144 [Corchorus olitorius]
MRGETNEDSRMTVRKRKKSKESKASKESKDFDILTEEWFPEIDISCSPVKLIVYQLVFHHDGVIVESPKLAYVNG